jgi:hypothetical protein
MEEMPHHSRVEWCGAFLDSYHLKRDDERALIPEWVLDATVGWEAEQILPTDRNAVLV